MTIRNPLRFPLLLLALFAFITASVAAQSPNTATMFVVVVDQSGAVVQDAKVSVVNTATGVDNNGDGLNNDRPAINGSIVSKSAFRSTPTSDVGLFVEDRIRLSEHTSLLLRLEGFNLFNHANMLGRGVTTYGNGATGASTFGQFVGGVGTSTNAIPAFANIDPPRMFQLQARIIF